MTRTKKGGAPIDRGNPEAVLAKYLRRAAILKGEAGISRKKRGVPFRTVKDKFLAAVEVSNRPNTLRGYKQHLAQLSRTFGQVKLSEISPFLIEKHRQRRLAEGSPVGSAR